MKKRRKIAAFVIAALLVLPAAFGAAGLFRAPSLPFAASDSARAGAINASLGIASSAPAVPSSAPVGEGERRIVRFRDHIPREAVCSALENSGLEYTLPADSGSRLFVVRAPETHPFFAENAELIAYSEPDRVRTVLAATDDPVRQPSYDLMGIYDAWDEVTASPDVIVAVLDTGVWREHEDLEGVNILPGYNAVERTAGVYADSSGHGTAVIGVIAAAAGNRKGSAGVAYGVTVLPVKVSSTRTAIYSSDIISGIRFAADAGAKIINLSVGGYSSSYAEQEAVNYALSKGCVIIAASGNEGNRSLAGRKSYPASYEGVISVASSDAHGARSAFSQYNECVDVAAPGENVLVPVWEDGVSGYKRDSGTSYSCAFVSGIAALALSGPAKGVRYGGGEFLAAIIDTCGSARGDELGHGVINAPEILRRSALPLITGVVNGGFYYEKVSVGFNFGEATLDGEPILDGETVTANGRHVVNVRYGGSSVGAAFRIDRDPLTCEYKEHADHSVFEFTRGYALLDGFPYASGTPVTSSGRHRFILTDGDETVEKTVDVWFAAPEVRGIEDGGKYASPVGISVVGGYALLDGAPVGNAFAVSSPGEHTLTVFGADRRRSQAYRFTVEDPPDHGVYYGDTVSRGAAVDEEYGYAVFYGDTAGGARVCLLDSPDRTEYTVGEGRIYAHAFETDFLLLFGEDGVTLLERAEAASAEGHVSETVAPDREISAAVLCGGKVCCFAEETLYSLDYFSGRTEPLAELGFDCVYMVADGGRICALPYEGSTKIHVIDAVTYDSAVLETGIPVYSESLLFAEGRIVAGNRVFDASNGELLCESGGLSAVALADGLVFSGAAIYDLASGETVGVYPEPLYRAYFGEKINLLLFESGRIDVVRAADGEKPRLFSAPYYGDAFTAPERADAYRSTLFYGEERRVISAAAGRNAVYIVFDDSNSLYSVGSGELSPRAPLPLRFVPRAVSAANGKVCVCFADVPSVLLAPENDIAAFEYFPLPAVCTAAFYDGERIVALCGGSVYTVDPADGRFDETGISARQIAPCGENVAALSADGLSLYGKDGALIARAAADTAEKLFGGEYPVCGANVYSSDDLEPAAVLDSPALFSDGLIAVTRGGVYSLPDGIYTGDTMSASCEVCASSGSELYTFGGGTLTVCGWGDGAPLSGGSFVEGTADGGVYTESVTPVCPRGSVFVDGAELPPNGSVTSPGRHVLVHPMPCGACITVNFTVLSRLAGVSFADAERDMNIGEQITLRLNYLPEGAGSFPAVFRAEPEGVSADGSGVVTAEKVGSYRVTAEVDAGYGVFTAVCTVTVRDDLIVFPRESGLYVDRNEGALRGTPPGLDPEYLLSMLPEGRNAVLLGADGMPATGPVSTGCVIKLLREDGSETDSLTVIVNGDTDGDGYVTAHDLFICERILMGYDYGPAAAAAADVSGDGIATNFDYSWLRNMLTGYFPGDKGTPPENNFGTVTALACTQPEPGGILDLVLCVNGCKYTRAFSGRIEYGSGLEYLSCESLGWDCGAYDDGASTGVYAYSPQGEAGMRPFLPLVHLRYRITAGAGETVRIACADGFSVSFESGARTVPFTEALVHPETPPEGEFGIEILNSRGFEFSGGSAMFAVIPYDAALADLRITRPAGSVVIAEGAAVPLGDIGTLHVSVSYADGRTEYYTVKLRREPAPGFDYNCRLSRLEVEGFRLDPAFDPDITEYSVSVPYGTEKIGVYCVKQNKTASVTVSDTAIKGEITVVTVSVVSPDGEEMVYSIKVRRLPPEESAPESGIREETSVPPEPRGSAGFNALIIAAAASLLVIAAVFAILRRNRNKKSR